MPLMIGSQAGLVAGMVAMEDLSGTGLGIPTKSIEATPVHYSRYLRRGDGTLIGQGYKQAEWHLNGIRDTHWAVFKALATSQSTWVYMRTYSEDGKTQKNYLALMHFPEAPPVRDHDTNVVLDFNLNFTQMVEL